MTLFSIPSSKRIADMIFQTLVVFRTQVRHEHLTRYRKESSKPVPCLGHYARGLTSWHEMHKHPIEALNLFLVEWWPLSDVKSKRESDNLELCSCLCGRRETSLLVPIFAWMCIGIPNTMPRAISTMNNLQMSICYCWLKYLLL